MGWDERMINDRNGRDISHGVQTKGLFLREREVRTHGEVLIGECLRRESKTVVYVTSERFFDRTAAIKAAS